MTCRMSGPIHGSGVRPADCQRDRPVGLFGQTQPVRHGDRRRAQFVGVRVAGVDDALRQGMGGEQHPHVAPGVCPHRRSPFGEVGGEEVDERRLGRPAVDADHRGLAGAVTASFQVLADRVRRVVRREHQPDDRVDTARCRTAAATSTFGSACFMPSDTAKRPGWRSSSERCSAWRWASVSSASGDTPPMAT